MSTPGSKAWAYRLVDEYEGGKPMKPTNVYRVAYEALGKVFPEGGRPCEPVPAQVQRRPAAPVPVPKRPPVEDPWWDSDRAAPDSN